MYKDYDDQELMYLIAENNEDAEEILYKKYESIVDIKSKKYASYAKKIGLEYSDLFQEGMVGLSEAISSYKEHMDTKFASFANICIDRQLFTALSKASRKKHTYLNDSYSLDFSIEDDGKTMLDYVFDNSSDPSLKLESEESKKILYDSLNNKLTNLEKKVFELKLKGFEYKEISKLLDKSYKSVDSALQRIRRKIKIILDNK